jgi:hypothetical protein
MATHQYDHEGRLIGGESPPCANTVAPPGEETLQALLWRTEAELRPHYPMQLDSETRLDAVTAGENALHHHYTLLNAALEDLDVEATRSALMPLVRQQAQSTPFLKLLMDKGAIIAFHYHDREGREIATIEVNAG